MLSKLGIRRKKKLFILGLDCAAPELVFTRWKEDLPNLTYLASNGIHGELQSSIPAITVPAWTSMLSGRDPGELGIYGFRNRADHTYENRFIADGRYVRVDRVWDYLSRAGKTSIIVGVPQTYPVKPLKGELVSGFLTPGIDSEFTYPGELRKTILSIAPDYDVDVLHYRTDDKDALLRQIWEMTEKRFRVVDRLLADPWDLFMLMEIGVDRIHHGFWSFHDPAHRRYELGNPYESAIRDYYIRIDQKLGEWLQRIGPETAVLVVSDHGAKRMDGGICINEWLWQEGYLAFEDEPRSGEVTSIGKMKIDWTRTKAWGEGGYYGRIYLNVEGREPQGILPAKEHDQFKDELSEKIAGIPGPDGDELGTIVFRPESIYKSVNRVAPDLMVYFGDLLWRSVGSLGHGSVYTFENDTGPDDCNHAQNGLFILHDPAEGWKGETLGYAQLMDITPTIFELMKMKLPPEVQGSSLMTRLQGKDDLTNRPG